MAICLFFLGTIFGSFYNVVAERITKKQSIVHPGSHCPNCKHVLRSWELIPIFSYIIQGGKCSKCKTKMGIMYPISELISGLLFLTCYLVFGFSLELLIALSFVSMLIIIVLSDIYYMIIEDVVLIFFGALILLEIFLINGSGDLITSLIGGLLSFVAMIILRIIGDLIFKKESLGGGDIKLMLVIGFIIGLEGTVLTIFLSAFLALPIALFLIKSKNHEIPYGPFLALASLIIYFTSLDFELILNFLRSF